MSESPFTDKETAFLVSNDGAVCRLATVTSSGAPYVVPVGFFFDPEQGVTKISLANLPGRGQERFWLRNLEHEERVAVTIDHYTRPDPEDIAAGRIVDPPTGVSFRGRAEIVPEGGEDLAPFCGPKWVKIVPTWITAWGIDGGMMDPPNARSVA